jgi:hypothetical protein
MGAEHIRPAILLKRHVVNLSDHRLAGSQLKSAGPCCPHFVHRLIEITSQQQQTQRTLLDWLLRVESGNGTPGNKLLAR